LYGKDHTEVATDLSKLAEVLQDNGNLEAAEPLHRRALSIREQHLGPDHPDLAITLSNLALLLQCKEGSNSEEVMSYKQRACSIWERAYAPASAPAKDGAPGHNTTGVGGREGNRNPNPNPKKREEEGAERGIVPEEAARTQRGNMEPNRWGPSDTPVSVKGSSVLKTWL
ncbi:unnamed protein product, partial [Discosporangium mesarthrocarpum]